MWAEQYAAADFKDAYETAKILRTSYSQGYPSYEFLFLSFAHMCQEGEAYEGWFLHKSKEYKKLKVYVAHAEKLFNESSTLPNSMEAVGKLLLNEVESFYDRINFDYVVRNITKAAIQKREQVVEIILSCLQIREDFKIKFGHRIFEKLLIELLSGAKFQWMHIGEGGVNNRFSFDAKDAFQNWKIFLDESDSAGISKVSDVLKGNLRYKIGSLSIVKNKRAKQRELRNACCLADHFFPEGGFLELAKTIAKEGGGATQEDVQPLETEESQLFSEKSALDFTDKKIHELLSEDREDADEASQLTEDQTQVSNGKNLNEDIAEESGLEVKDAKDVSEQQEQHNFQEESQAKSERPLPQDLTILENEKSQDSVVNTLSQPIKSFRFQSDFYIKTLIFILGCATQGRRMNVE